MNFGWFWITQMWFEISTPNFHQLMYPWVFNFVQNLKSLTPLKMDFPPALTVLNFNRAWQAHFLSHTHQTQKICCFSADVRIILLSFFKLSNCLKVGKNAGAFLSRCSELLGYTKEILIYMEMKASQLFCRSKSIKNFKKRY